MKSLEHQSLWSSLREKIGPGTIHFVRRTGLTTGAFLFAKIFTTLAIILLGRWIGEDGIGRSWGIVAGGMTLAAFLSMGLPPTLNVYIPKGQTDGRAEWSAGFYVSLGVLLGFALLYTPLEAILGHSLELSSTELLIAVGIGVVSNAYNLVTAALQGLHLARARVYCEIVMSVSAAAIALGLAKIGRFEETALPLGMLAGMVFGLLPAIPHLLPRTSISNISEAPLKLIAGYSGFSLLCGIGALFGSSLQRIQIKRLLSDGDLGLYGMASQASIGLAYTVAGAIGAVLIAKTAARLDKLQVMRQILRTWLLLSPAIVITMFVGQYVALKLAGFAFNPWLAVSLAFASLLIMVHTTLGNVMSGHGLWGSIVGVAFSAIHAATIWSLTEWLAPIYGITGGALALVGGYIVIIGIAIVSLPWFFRLPDFSNSESDNPSPPPA